MRCISYIWQLFLLQLKAPFATCPEGPNALRRPFTRDAEIINGRIGMVGFALLILVETWKAGPGLVP